MNASTNDTGNLVFNTEKPDGTMRKLTDVSKLNNLKAFGQGNMKLGEYLNKVVLNNLNFSKNCI